ncbi:hypothetical protein [Sphingobium mellinum]|uniref:hypothetical protein n=1 Tax=Sphingobium mellinum TaxID=1387166 RepID=UPI0030EB454E
MLNRALSVMSVVLALGTPVLARAAEASGAWTPLESAIRADAAGISLPQTVAGLSLSKSGEASNGGKSVDNYAQYLSDDGVIQATLYVYLPSYADASIAAYMTDKAVMERFGAKTRRTSYEAVALAGRPKSAIRAVYDDAADGALTTAAAFVHAGRWIVKLRVTGPAERRQDVLAGLDGMLNNLRFDQPRDIRTTRPAQFAACPRQGADDTGAPAPVTSTATLPRDGDGPLCIRDRVLATSGSYDVLQQPGVQGSAVIVPVDDAGTILAFDPSAAGHGYQLSIHAIGQTELFGTYEKVPGAPQIAEILDGKDPQTAQARATAVYAANGEVTTRAGGATAR